MYLHASMRWAGVVVGAIDAESDPKTMAAWARTIGVGCSALRVRCRAAHEPPRNSLYFCRMLRAVAWAQSRGWQPENILDVIDERTLRKLLAQAGLGAINGTTPTIDMFLCRQKFITNPANIAAVAKEIARRQHDEIRVSAELSY